MKDPAQKQRYSHLAFKSSTISQKLFLKNKPNFLAFVPSTMKTVIPKHTGRFRVLFVIFSCIFLSDAASPRQYGRKLNRFWTVFRYETHTQANDQHDQSHERKDHSDVDGRFGILNFFRRCLQVTFFFNPCPLFTLLLFSIMPMVVVRIMDKMGDGPIF